MSQDYRCTTCNIYFARKSSYNRHLISQKHIEKCIPNNPPEYRCACGNVYMYKTGLLKHRHKCSFTTESTNTDYELLLLEREKLKYQVEQLLESSHVTINNSIENQNINIIQINSFGNETIDYLSDDEINDCINRVYDSVPSLIREIHFNPAHPENHNIKITNKKLPHASIMDSDNKWQLIDKELAITTLVDNGYNILDHRFNKNPAAFTEDRRRHYRRFQEKYDSCERETMKRIKNDVELVVLNGTKNIHMS
jgi:hypothetical protein